MCKLIVYCQSIPYKHGEFSLNCCCEMHSLSENVANVLNERNPLGEY